MTSAEFLYLIQGIFQRCSFEDYLVTLEEKINFFLSQFEKVSVMDLSPTFQMTKATILFEGFYRHIDESVLKFDLAQIRTKRWEHHFGTPTLLFLLSYKQQIDETQRFFSAFVDTHHDTYPWMSISSIDAIIDESNQTINIPTALSQIELPSPEVTGFFTKTHNPLGGFATTPCDPISQQFIQQAEEVARAGGKILEIGAAFGAATIAAISKGSTVFCNDIDVNNLSVVRQRYIMAKSDEDLTPSGDTKKLILVPGALPHELTGLPEGYFDAILICRVLHFFTGEKIEESLRLCAKLLNPTGTIYIVCETPFLKNWQKFIPEFERRVDAGAEWPGEINNPSEFESSGRAESLPKFVHWITKDILERSLLRTGFSIEHVDYIDRKGQFPEDLLLPEYGKESVGAIAKYRG